MLKKYFSTWGLGAVVIYVIFTVGLVLYATQCTGTFCGLIAGITIMPWPLLLQSIEAYIDYESYGGAVFVIFNILILYFIFAMLQKRAER